MKASTLAAASAAALGLALALPGVAQTTTGARTAAGTGLTMPYQRDFWGHVGISAGVAELNVDCVAGAPCDLDERHIRVHAGGRFNNIFGGEVAYLDFGDFTRGGGDTKARGLNFSLLAGIPIGTNSSVFGKLGLGYTRTSVSGNVPGFQTGTARGWGPSVGIGAQLALTPNWAVRGDLDRYRFRLPEGRNNMDALTLGVQYSFR
jgi:OmpA-OmpF porin, OOP family